MAEHFRPPKSFSFTRRKFGSTKRSFRAERREKFSWIHCDVSKDAAFRFLCMQCEEQNEFLASTKREPAFIFRGFTYWRESTSAFREHAASDCHSEAVEALVVLPSSTKDVGELHIAQHAVEKAKNRKMFLLMLPTCSFLLVRGWCYKEMVVSLTATSPSLFTCAETMSVHDWIDEQTSILHQRCNTSVCSLCLYTVCARSARQSLALHVSV